MAINIGFGEDFNLSQGPLQNGAMLDGGGSLFKPNQLSLPGLVDNNFKISSPVSTPEDDAIDAFMRANGINDIMQGRAAYYSSQQPGVTEQMPSLMEPPPSPYGGMTPGDALGGGLTMQKPSPQQQLNTPSFAQIAQAQPFMPVSQPVPMMTQPPATQAVVQQLQAPTTGAPTTPVPLVNAPPATQQLIQQIKAPTTIRTPAPSPVAKQLAANPFAPRPVVKPAVMAQPRPVMAQRPMARSVSRINPPLLPSRPMGRR